MNTASSKRTATYRLEFGLIMTLITLGMLATAAVLFG